MNYKHKKVAYKCQNAIQPHGFTLAFDEMPPDRCPRCNAAVGRTSTEKLADTTPIQPRPATLL